MNSVPVVYLSHIPLSNTFCEQEFISSYLPIKVRSVMIQLCVCGHRISLGVFFRIAVYLTTVTLQTPLSRKQKQHTKDEEVSNDEFKKKKHMKSSVCKTRKESETFTPVRNDWAAGG